MENYSGNLSGNRVVNKKPITNQYDLPLKYLYDYICSQSRGSAVIIYQTINLVITG